MASCFRRAEENGGLTGGFRAPPSFGDDEEAGGGGGGGANSDNNINSNGNGNMAMPHEHEDEDEQARARHELAECALELGGEGLHADWKLCV